MPDPEFTGAQLEKLHNAILDAFDIMSLKQLLTFRLGKRLDVIAAHDKPMRDIVFNLLTTAQQEGWLDQLIHDARAFVPGNSKLAAIDLELFGNQKAEPSVPEPVSPRNIAIPLFKHAEILKIADLLMGANLVAEESMQALQGGMNLDFRSSLPSTGELRSRLMNTLHILNSTGELVGGEVPFRTFLSNAIYLAKPRSEAAALEKLLQQLQ